MSGRARGGGHARGKKLKLSVKQQKQWTAGVYNHRQTVSPPATPPRLQPAPELQSHLHGGTMILSLAQTWSSLSWSHNCSSLVNDRLCNLIPHAHTTQPPTSLSGFLGSHSSLFLHLHIVPTQSHMLLSPLTHWAILQFTFWNYWTLLGEGNNLHVRLKGQRNCLL